MRFMPPSRLSYERSWSFPAFRELCARGHDRVELQRNRRADRRAPRRSRRRWPAHPPAGSGNRPHRLPHRPRWCSARRDGRAAMTRFEVGRRYRRRDLHDQFGGQQQGGISTPRDHPFIMLITGESGTAYGYHDGWEDDGPFRYFGEGQTGDMQFHSRKPRDPRPRRRRARASPLRGHQARPPALRRRDDLRRIHPHRRRSRHQRQPPPSNRIPTPTRSCCRRRHRAATAGHSTSRTAVEHTSRGPTPSRS